MKYLSAFIVLAFVSAAPAQDLLARIATLETNNVTLLSRMASVESKIDALSAKVDKLVLGSAAVTTAPLATVSTLLAPFTATACSPGSSAACGSNGAPTIVYGSDGQAYYTSTASGADACGSASGSSGTPFMQRGPVRRFFGRLGAGKCGG